MNLELLAKRKFDQYALKNKIKANWNYLSHDRKVSWLQEIVESAKQLTKELKMDIKPLANLNGSAAGYERGYNAGIRHERMKFTELLNNFETDLENQLNKFIQYEHERNRVQNTRRFKE